MNEAEAKFGVHFSLGRHTYFDVSLLPTIRQQAEVFWGPAGSNRNIYWKEDLAASHSLMRAFSRLTSEGCSFLDGFIQACHLTNPVLRRKLHPFELAAARNLLLLSDGGTGDVQTDTQIASAVFLMREWEMLDAMSQTRTIEVIPETCPDDTAQTRKKQSIRMYATLFSITGALKKDGVVSAQMLKDYSKSLIQFQASHCRERNMSCLNTLMDITKEAKKTHQSTRVFVRIGELHYPLVERLKEKLRLASLDTNVTYIQDYGELLPLPESKLILALEEDTRATFTKEQLLPALIGNIIESYLISKNQGRTPETVSKIQKALDNSTTRDLERLVAQFPRIGMGSAIQRFIVPKTVLI